jgi:hypothetical protein
MKRTLCLAACLLALAGCGLSAKIDPRTAYQKSAYRKSVDDYNACANANPTNLQACEGKRLAMEADERAFNNMSAGPAPDANTTGNENY